jgi:hypothetical protein
MKSPDGRREVVKSAYDEMRMGSPLFGCIEVLGGVAATVDRTFGEAMSFDAASRLLAIEEFLGAPRNSPHTRAVVFDLDAGTEAVVHDQNPGFVKKLIWEPDGSLTIVAWSHLTGDAVHRSAWRDLQIALRR